MNDEMRFSMGLPLKKFVYNLKKLLIKKLGSLYLSICPKHSYSFKKPPYMSLRCIKKVSQTRRQLVNL